MLGHLPNGLELSCPAEAGRPLLLYAQTAGDSSIPEGAVRRVSFSELLGGRKSARWACRGQTVQFRRVHVGRVLVWGRSYYRLRRVMSFTFVDTPGKVILLGNEILQEVPGEVFATLQIISKERNREVIYAAYYFFVLHHHVSPTDERNQDPVRVHKMLIDIAGCHLIRNEVIGCSRDNQGRNMYRGQSLRSV